MTLVQGDLTYPDGTVYANRPVRFRLADGKRAFFPGSHKTITREHTTNTDSAGHYEVDLYASDAMLPVGMPWMREIHYKNGAIAADLLLVPESSPSGGGAWWEDQLIVLSEPTYEIPSLTDQLIQGAKSFQRSPLIPNPTFPTSNPFSAVSKGEVQDMMAQQPLLSGSHQLHYASLKTRGILAPVINTAVETSCLVAPVAIPMFPQFSVLQANLSGQLRNVSGASVTYTFRIKKDATVLATVPVTVPIDAATARMWRLTITAEGFTSNSYTMEADVFLSAGTTDAMKHVGGVGVGGWTEAPGTFDVTVQMSVAQANSDIVIHHGSWQWGILP